jgi:hypothetical protein
MEMVSFAAVLKSVYPWGNSHRHPLDGKLSKPQNYFA